MKTSASVSHALLLLVAISPLVVLAPACNNDPRGPIPYEAGLDPNRDEDHDGVTVADGDCNDLKADVHPRATEVCGDFIDQDCDGVVDPDCDNDKDGTTASEGDCNDADALIGPWAIDDPNTDLKEDCGSGKANAPCLGPNPTDAERAAAAMEVCATWLNTASWNTGSNNAGRAIRAKYGRYVVPKAGQDFLLFSTGAAEDETNPNMAKPQPGTPFQNTDANPLIALETPNYCNGRMDRAPDTVQDAQILTLELRAPQNATGLSLWARFYSAEYPENVGAAYNDTMAVIVDSKVGKRNILITRKDRLPVNVNNPVFEHCNSSPVCTAPPHPMWKGWTCTFDTTLDPGDLTGTGFDWELGPADRIGGATGWLPGYAELEPGETFTMQIIIYDAGDRDWNSTALIDAFEWETTPTKDGIP